VKHPERHPDRKIGVNMTVFEPNIEGVLAMGALAAGLELDYLAILHGTALELTRADGMETDRRDPRLIEQLARIRKSFPWLTLNDYATGRTCPRRRFCNSTASRGDSDQSCSRSKLATKTPP